MKLIDYEKKYLVKRLEQMHPKYRCVFSLWCFHGMMKKCGELFDRGMRKKDSAMIAKEFDTIWNNVINGNIISAEYLHETKEKFNKLATAVDDIKYPFCGFYIELISGYFSVLEVIERDNVECAASVALDVINCIDLELDNKGINLSGDGFMSYPDVKTELDAQSNMLDYLDGSPILARNDFERFR